METRGWGSQYKYAMEFGKEFTAQEVRDLEFVFKTFDGEGRGLIQAEEVRKALGHLAFKVSRKAVQLLLKDLELVNSKSASRNTAGSTDFEGFLHIVAKLQGISCDHYDEIIKVRCFISIQLC